MTAVHATVAWELGAEARSLAAAMARGVGVVSVGSSGDAWHRDAHPEAIDEWGAALERGDDVEVDRLVQQSRADRSDGAATGRLGIMLGQADTSSRDEVTS